jgi:hypothetical protein
MDIGGLLFGAAKGATSLLDDMAGAALTMESIAKTGKAPKVLMAPNGKPSKLTPQQWAEVRTPAFKKGFGDWENDPTNATKALDENGEPRVFYHGTTKSFDTFDPAKSARTDRAASRNLGFFFTDSLPDATRYAQWNGAKGSVLPVYLNTRAQEVMPWSQHEDLNMGVFNKMKESNFGFTPEDQKLWEQQETARVKGMRQNIIESGKDGINIVSPTGKRLETVVFDPKQIKSAAGNNGNFDMTDPNIYKALLALPFGGAMLGGMTAQGGRQ